MSEIVRRRRRTATPSPTDLVVPAPLEVVAQPAEPDTSALYLSTQTIPVLLERPVPVEVATPRAEPRRLYPPAPASAHVALQADCGVPALAWSRRQKAATVTALTLAAAAAAILAAALIGGVV